MKQFRQFGIFGGVTPSGPDSLDFGSLSNVQDQLHICVVVVVRAALNGNILIRKTNVFCTNQNQYYQVCGISQSFIIVRLRSSQSVDVFYQQLRIKWAIKPFSLLPTCPEQSSCIYSEGQKPSHLKKLKMYLLCDSQHLQTES